MVMLSSVMNPASARTMVERTPESERMVLSFENFLQAGLGPLDTDSSGVRSVATSTEEEL